jgi:CDP-diacylglycerol--serine O-phosphatidyltransferase
MTAPTASVGPPGSETENERSIRYLAPNLITLTSLLFGITSIAASYHHNWVLSGWMIIYSVLCDRLDGMVARRLHATSELGLQLDSIADFLNFGLAPPFLIYAYVCSRPDLPFDDGWERPYLLAACAVWTLAAAFRLARFNIQSDDKVPTKVYFGVPTTLAGGMVAIWFLAFLKYSTPGPTFGGPKIFGGWITPHAVWLWMPVVIAVGGLLMASTVRVPKVGKTANKGSTAFVLVMVLFGYVCGFARMLPELMIWQPTIWLVVFLIVGLFSDRLRGLQPPPLFPRRPDSTS